MIDASPAALNEGTPASAWEYRSDVPGAAWPAVPDGRGAAVLALLFQLERTQWLPAERLRELQFEQLRVLVRHAFDSAPFYREHWRKAYDPAAPLTPERFAALPVLTRAALQERHSELRSRAVPQDHGAVAETRTSGSTGMPVRVLKTELCGLFWRAFTLRDHLWHGRDLGGRLAAIRLGVASGEAGNWGAATSGLLDTGPVATQPVSLDVDRQLEWLQQQRPDYLLTYPSIAAELARTSLERGIRLPGLREVRTIGETLEAEVRGLCRDAWGARVTDLYSADEIGYAALQCPQQEHHHVQAEAVLLEVVDANGRPCAPGETGRVLVTGLHNFATPLVRYEIGDYAELGEPCSCGRGLPVLRRIAGRVRNMLVTATGERYWPSFGLRHQTEVPKLRQYQLVQKEIDLIEARLVTSARLSAGEERVLRERILSRIPAGFRLEFAYPERIERSASGKYEEFVCELAAARR